MENTAALSNAPESFDPVMLTLCARLAGTTPDDYVQRNEEILTCLEKFEFPNSIKTEESYRQAQAIKSLLSGLFCYAANTNNPEFERVADAENRWGRMMAQYNRRCLIKDPKTRSLARYLLWNSYFLTVNLRVALEEAKRQGILRRGRDDQGQPQNTLLVVGLEMKVGDNVFTVDRRGREHRQYVKTIGRQAFSVSQKYREVVDETFMDSIPVVDETYRHTSIGDHKHGARPISLRYSERDSILQRFVC